MGGINSSLGKVFVCVISGLSLLGVNNAKAQNFGPPDSGLVVLDLAGQTIPENNDVQDYSTSFVASSAESTLTFVFRHDPGYFTMNNVVVSDLTNPSDNLIVNGDFTQGGVTPPGGGSPGWTYFEQEGITFQGLQNPGVGWFDGSTGGYDGIDQSFVTVAGQTYDITFTLAQSSTVQALDSTNYQQISTNGLTGTSGNGIDMLVYAGDGLPPTEVTVPEPSTWALLFGGLGLLAICEVRRRRLARMS